MKDTATPTDAAYSAQAATYSTAKDDTVDIDDFVASELRDPSEFEEEYSDSWSYETPRPWLTIEQAARMLGRSTRGVERSILGRWGNQLPEGWSARRVRIDEVAEWRIVPPPGFRIKHNRRDQGREEKEDLTKSSIEDVVVSPVDDNNTLSDEANSNRMSDSTSTATRAAARRAKAASQAEKNKVDDQPFSFEKFFHSAGRMAQKELASFGLTVRSNAERAVDADVEHATIVIDRSDEVEKLLRELAETRKELADQTRMHLEDLRLMHEMQTSMRLLEVHAKETSELKQDLSAAQIALREHRAQYQAFLALPWYKRLFRQTP
jgi:hypothetical protein